MRKKMLVLASASTGTLQTAIQKDSAVLESAAAEVAAAADEKGSSNALVLGCMAARQMQVILDVVGLACLSVISLAQLWTQRVGGAPITIPPEHLDKVTEYMGVSEEQLQGIIQGLQIITDCQHAKEQELEEVSAELLRLLCPSGILPPVLQDSSQQDTVAAAIVALCSGQWGWRSYASSAGSQAAQSSTTLMGSAAYSPEPDMGHVLGLLPCGHLESLIAVAQRLVATQQKVFWFDLCCLMFVSGQLTWQQGVRFNIGMAPYHPNLQMWARRLMARAHQQRAAQSAQSSTSASYAVGHVDTFGQDLLMSGGVHSVLTEMVAAALAAAGYPAHTL
jgi:hypothetical protein